MNLQELQDAIGILFNPTIHNALVQQQAQQYCNQFTQNNASQLVSFFQLFIESPSQPTRFWILQAIIDILNNLYGQVMQSKEQRVAVHQAYMLLLRDHHQVVFSQSHYQVKYALIYVLLVKEDFPEVWPEAFKELLSLLQSTQDTKLQSQYMGNASDSQFHLVFIVKVLLMFEEELVERQDTKPMSHLVQATKVKDGLRAGVIGEVIFALFQILQNHQVFEQETVNETLEVISQLIDWNSLEYFSGAIELFKMFLQMDQYRTQALSCLHAIVHKGMDYSQKVELIVNLNFLEIIESFQIKYRERNQDDEFDEQEQEEEFFTEVSEIIDKLGQWCLELFANHEKMLPTPEHQKQYEFIFQRVLQLAITVLDTDKPKIGRNCIEFLLFFLQALKKVDIMATLYNQVLQKLLVVVIQRAKYPSWCTFLDGSVLSDHEEDYIVYRDEVASLFNNLAQIKPFHENFIQTMHQLLQSIQPTVTPVNQAEVALFLIYHLLQSIPPEHRELTANEPSEKNPYYQLVIYIVRIDFFKYDHKIVILMLLENLVRYSSFFLNEPQFIQQIPMIFFSPKAIMSNQPQLASRSCYLLLKLVEKLQAQLTPMADQIIDSTVKVIQKVESGQHQEHLITYDDLIFLYNILGNFVTNKRIDYEYRRKVAVQMMDSLVTRLVQCQNFEMDKIVWILKFLNVFTKGFQSEISPGMKESFSGVLQKVLSILPPNIKNSAVTDQILQYLQRNIQLLGVEVKPYLIMVAQPILAGLEFERLEIFLTILNYAVLALKGQVLDIIDQLLLPLFQKMSSVKIPTSDLSDIDKVSIKIFTSIFKTLQNATAIDSTFFVSVINLNYLIDFVNYMVQHFEEGIDKNIKRIISAILKDLFVDLNGLSNLPMISKKTQDLQGAPFLSYSSLQRDSPLYVSFIERVLICTTRGIFSLNPNLLDEQMILKNLIDITALYVQVGYNEQLAQACQLLQINQQAIVEIISICQALGLKQINLKQAQDTYIVSLTNPDCDIENTQVAQTDTKVR